MAKKKVAVDFMGMESAPTISLYDLKGEAPDLAVGDKVKLIVIGRIKEIGEREGYDKKGVVHNIMMERFKCKFTKIHEADDMDMEEYAKYRQGKEGEK